MTEIQNATYLIQAIACRIVAHPEGVEVPFLERSDGSIDVALKCHPDDEGRLIGKRGCHVQAFAFLVAQMGKAVGRPYKFRLVTDQANKGKKWELPPEARDYDPDPVLALLIDLLAELDLGQFSASVRHESPATFTFVVTLREADDRAKLDMSDPDAETVGNAIATLWRAIGRADGCTFTWEITT